MAAQQVTQVDVNENQNNDGDKGEVVVKPTSPTRKRRDTAIPLNVGNREQESPPSPKKKVEDVVDNPIRFLDTMCTLPSKLGNTPRPSQVMNDCLEGLRLVGDRKHVEAHKLFSGAVTAAQKKATSKGATSDDLEKYAMVCASMGYNFLKMNPPKFNEGEVMYRNSLKQWTQIHGKSSPKLLEFMNDVAKILERSLKFKEALAILKRCERIAQTVGENSVIRAQALINLAVFSCKKHTRKVKSAEAYFKQSIEILKSEDTATYKTNLVGALFNYSQFLRAAGRVDEANATQDDMKELGETLS